MAQPAAEKETLSSNMFYLWRCVIALAHADGGIDAEERKYLAHIFKNMHRRYTMTAEQKKTFVEDLDTPKNFGDMLRNINDPEYRSLVIYYGNILAHDGGVARPTENDVLKRLTANQMAGIDLDKLRAEIREINAKNQAERAAELKALHEKASRNPYFHPIDVLLLKMGIDLLA
jgi:hypothetical protein